jgi:hypothetical protein
LRASLSNDSTSHIQNQDRDSRKEEEEEDDDDDDDDDISKYDLDAAFAAAGDKVCFELPWFFYATNAWRMLS